MKISIQLNTSRVVLKPAVRAADPRGRTIMVISTPALLRFQSLSPKKQGKKTITKKSKEFGQFLLMGGSSLLNFFEFSPKNLRS